MNKKKFESGKTCCANCYFFDEFPIQKKEDNLLGSCHSRSPFPAPEDPYAGENEKKSKLGVWPLVLGSFWCGDYANKEELKKAENGK